MGTYASKLSRLVSRPVKNYNIEQRAVKEMERQKEKPVVAPKHKSTEAILERQAAEFPDIASELRKKDDDLLDRLKGLYVEPVQERVPDDVMASKKPLPTARGQKVEDEYGFVEPETIPEGKITLRQALDFIAQHQLDPEGHSAQNIAQTHKLGAADVKNVLKYYQSLNLVIPEEGLENNQQILDQFKLKPAPLKELPEFLERDTDTSKKEKK